MTPVPIAGDVQVTFPLSNDLDIDRPAVASLLGGGFVVTWTSYLQYSDLYDIYGQRYAADGTNDGSAFRISGETKDYEVLPTSVTALFDGGFLVTWSSLNRDGSDFDVYGQRYAADGAQVGSEFKINTYTANGQSDPSVTSLSDHGFVVTWTSQGQDGSLGGIYGQRYAADGTAVGPEFNVNTYTLYDQVDSSVASLSDGGFVVTWTSSSEDADGNGISGRRYAANGMAIGAEFHVNAYTAGEQLDSSVTSLADGGFVVTWSSSGQDGYGFGVYGQRYGADGKALGGEFQVNTYTANSQQYPSLTSLPLPDGGFVVSWTSDGHGGDGTGIYGQRYGSDGTPVGTEFPLNQTTGNVVAGSVYGPVATLVDNHLVQVWSDARTEELFFRLFSVPGLNTFPSITSDGAHATAAISVAENTTTVTTVVAKDPDTGQTLTYSLSGGADKPAFTIDGSTGALSFVGAPDFEEPADADKNNVYEVVVKVSDGAGGSATQAISVTVTDQNDVAPTITTKPDLSVAENTQIVTTLTATDPDTVGTAPAKFSISGGADAALFNVAGGDLVFKRTPDYETSPHTYHLQVTAFDGVNHTDQPLSVTLTDQQEEPGVTSGFQGNPAVTKLLDGGVVVAWPFQNGSDSDVFGQRFSKDGYEYGTVFRVNTQTADNQDFPSVASLSDGGFVVTWSSYAQDGSGSGIYGQRYAENGSPVGGEFQVNTYTANGQAYSSVTPLSDGRFVVTWMSLDQDGSGYGIYGQRYVLDGTAAGGEFQVNTYTGGDQRNASATLLRGGGFVVTWESVGQDGSGSGIYGQHFAENGSPVGGEFKANTYTAGDQTAASTASLAGGGFVVTWTSRGQDGSGDGIYGQRYGSDGTAAGGEFQVNTFTSGDQRNSSVTSLPDGGYVVTWGSVGQSSFGTGVYGQRYAPDGQPVGGEFMAPADDTHFVQEWGTGTIEVSFRQVLLPTFIRNDNAPVITTEADLAIAEGRETVAALTATDADTVGTARPQFSISGGADAVLFDVAGGDLVFKTARDYETDPHSYQVEVAAFDGAHETRKTLTVTLTDQNDNAPVISTPAALSVAENMLVMAALTSTDLDTVGTTPAEFSVIGGPDAALFDVAGGNLVFKTAPDFETDKHSYQVEVTAFDGLNHSTPKTLTVSLSDQNDVAPTITTQAALSVAENTQLVAALTSTDPDTVGTNPAQFSISGGPDAALFDVAGGNLVFRTAPDFETNKHAYQVEVTAFDGVNHSAKMLTVTLTDVSGVIITGTKGPDNVNATTTVPGQPLPTPEDDKIYGLAGVDVLDGGPGNDLLDGGVGSDFMSGGPGNDTYVVDYAGDNVIEKPGEGIDEVQAWTTYTLPANVEKLTLMGDDAIDGTGNGLDNRIAGNDRDNVLDGGAGRDTMSGGLGNDTYKVDAAADTIIEKPGEGVDLVISTASQFTLPAEVENLTLGVTPDKSFGVGNELANTLVGNDVVNTLIGNGGNDRLDGGAGADYLLGGTGNDLYKVDDTFDFVDEGIVFPLYAGSAGDVDTIASTAAWFWDAYSVGERLQIAEGAAGSDGAGSTIVGSMFSNEMIGNSGTNILFGRGGGDTYRAGDGVDWISLSLLGLTEKNAYAGVDAANTIIVDPRHTGAFSYDIVLEFEAGKDKIDVKGYGYATAAEVLQQGHNDGLGNSYYALGDGYDYVYLIGVTTDQVHAMNFVV